MFKEYLEYFETLKIDKSKETYRSYNHILKCFVNNFNINNINDIKKLQDSDIQNYINILVTKKENNNLEKINKSKATANAHLRVIKAFLNWMVSKKYIENSPAESVYKFKEGKFIPSIFTKEERDNTILNTKNKIELQMMMAVLFYTGLRREEAVNVKISDIVNGVLLVHGKGNKERDLALTPFIQELINKCLSQRKYKTEYLFASARGGHQITTTALYKRVKVACKLANIDSNKIDRLSPHSVRRSLACFLLIDGASSFVIKNVLGHSDIKTTERYVKPALSLGSNKVLMSQMPPSWFEEDDK